MTAERLAPIHSRPARRRLHRAGIRAVRENHELPLVDERVAAARAPEPA